MSNYMSRISILRDDNRALRNEIKTLKNRIDILEEEINDLKEELGVYDENKLFEDIKRIKDICDEW